MSIALRSLLHRDEGVLPVVGRYGQCAICRSGYLSCEGESHWFQFVLWRCDHCGVYQRFPMPVHVESREQHGIAAPLRDPVQDWTYIAQYLGPTPGRLLQIECGSGELLVEAQKAGWEAYGLERSEYVARQAKREHDLSIETGTLEECGYQDGAFDAIVLWNLLELSRDPQRFLQRAAQKLKPGGRLFLRTPNTGSLIKKIAGRFWAQWVPVHRFLFDVPSLRELCGGAGLIPLDIRTPGTRLWSSAFLQKTGWLPFLARSIVFSKLYERMETHWHLSVVTPDPLYANKWDWSRWMEKHLTGDQIVMVAERIDQVAPECLLCHSTMIDDDAKTNFSCLRCGLRQKKLVASTPQKKSGGEVKFFRAQQYAGTELLLAAEKKGLTGRLLDVGCGDGGFMQLARQRGWDVWGSEPGDYKEMVTSPLIALRIIKERDWSERFMPESCQLITLWDALHQSADPSGLLKAAGRLLAPEGRIVARVINPRVARNDSLPVFLRRFFSEGSVCWFYQPEHLKAIFKSAGLVDVHIVESEYCVGTQDEPYDLPREWRLRSNFVSQFKNFVRNRKRLPPWLYVTARRSSNSPARRLRTLHVAESLTEDDLSDVVLAGIEALPYNQIQSDAIAGTLRSSERMTALRRRGVTVKPLEPLSQLSDPRASWKILKSLVACIREGSYDVVHFYGWRVAIAGRLAAQWVRWRSGHALPRRIIYQPMGHRFYGAYGVVISYGIKWLERFLGTSTDVLVVPTERGAFEFAARQTFSFKKMAVIPEGVTPRVSTTDAAVVRRGLNLPEDAWYVGYWGPLTDGVGIDDLLQAIQTVFSTRPEARLLIVGMGEKQLHFEALARQMSIFERVHFFENNMNLPTFLSAVDVVVVPTPVDGIPRIALQAGAACKPVVITDVGGHSIIVLDDITGVLVPVHDPGAMAKVLLKLEQKPKDDHRMGIAAHAWIERMEDGAPQFSEERMKTLMRSLYEEILERRAG